MERSRALVLGLVFLVVCMAASAAHAVTYSLTPIPYLAGDQYNTAMGINSSGRVVGSSWSNDNQIILQEGNAYVWQPGTGIVRVSSLPGGDDVSRGLAINGAGKVTGVTAISGGSERAFIWDSVAGMRDLGSLSDCIRPRGTGINSADKVVGYCAYRSGATYLSKAFIWQDGGGMTEIADLDGGTQDARASAINDAGQVVGRGTASTGHRAFLWQAGSPVLDLGDLPGGTDFSSASAINNSGKVVGTSGATSSYHAFLWTAGSAMRDLGYLVGFDGSAAQAINDLDQVVGSCSIFNSLAPTNAFVWTEGEGMQNLNGLLDASGQGWTLTEAYGINNTGQIVGIGLNSSGDKQAYLLNPVPEPGSLLALTGGLGTLLIRRRRR